MLCWWCSMNGFTADLPLMDTDNSIVRRSAVLCFVSRQHGDFKGQSPLPSKITWACRQGLCRSNPMAERSPLRGSRRLPRPIREQHEQRSLDAVITLRGAHGELVTIVNSRHCAFAYHQRLEAFGPDGMLSAANVTANQV